MHISASYFLRTMDPKNLIWQIFCIASREIPTVSQSAPYEIVSKSLKNPISCEDPFAYWIFARGFMSFLEVLPIMEIK